MNKNFDYDDINLIPKKCIVDSRSECDTKVKLGKHLFEIPAMPANMKATINESLAEKLIRNNYFYVMHRFDIDIKEFIRSFKEKNLITSISIGVNEPAYQLINQLKFEQLIPDYITVDIAHGHAIKMERMLKTLRDTFGNDVYIMAGNVSTIDGTNDLAMWGADGIKVGIGPGSACTTYPETGFGSRNRQASTVYECAEGNIYGVDIIGDGGIRNVGDIVKNYVLGAKMSMVGGMFSAFTDSPGNQVVINNEYFKEFYGSASVHNGNKKNRIEGKKTLIPEKPETLLTYLNRVKESIQSAISYGGGNKLDDLYDVLWS